MSYVSNFMGGDNIELYIFSAVASFGLVTVLFGQQFLAPPPAVALNVLDNSASKSLRLASNFSEAIASWRSLNNRVVFVSAGSGLTMLTIGSEAARVIKTCSCFGDAEYHT